MNNAHIERAVTLTGRNNGVSSICVTYQGRPVPLSPFTDAISGSTPRPPPSETTSSAKSVITGKDGAEFASLLQILAAGSKCPPGCRQVLLLSSKHGLHFTKTAGVNTVHSIAEKGDGKHRYGLANTGDVVTDIIRPTIRQSA